jgi:CSLREA domain-containing protein
MALGHAAAAAVLVAVASHAGATSARVSSPPSVTFTVNSTADRADAISNGLCETSVSGECTLRAAIQEADVAHLPVTIAFAIPGGGVHTIVPATQLPTLSNASHGITIDGFTESGSAPNTDSLADNAVRTIEIAGQGPSGIDGIQITSSGNLVRGIIIHGFRRAFLLNKATTGSNAIVGDLIGLMPDGTYDPTDQYVPGSSCIEISNGAHDNVIGAPGNATRNTISGCSHQGVALFNVGTTRNTIQNNIMGLDPTGTQRRRNQSHGVDINTGTTFTMVGGTGTEQRNVISGMSGSGIEISHISSTQNNSVVGNYIGTDLTGTAANSTTANVMFGVNLEGKGDCGSSPCPPDANHNSVLDNVIVNNGAGGVILDKGVHDDVVAHNLIGVLPDHAAAPNGYVGVRVEAGAFSNTIGPGNEIAFNPRAIMLQPTGTQPASSVSSPTNRNRFTQNSIHDASASLAIDLYPYTVANSTIGDANTNEGVATPTLTGANAASVRITTCGNCTVELFLSTRGAGVNGQGITYLATATAPSSGALTMSVPSAAVGHVVTATTTTPNGSTSEFAKGVAVR